MSAYLQGKHRGADDPAHRLQHRAQRPRPLRRGKLRQYFSATLAERYADFQPDIVGISSLFTLVPQPARPRTRCAGLLPGRAGDRRRQRAVEHVPADLPAVPRLRRPVLRRRREAAARSRPRHRPPCLHRRQPVVDHHRQDPARRTVCPRLHRQPRRTAFLRLRAMRVRGTTGSTRRSPPTPPSKTRPTTST